MSKATPRLGKGLSALLGTRPNGPFKHRAPQPAPGDTTPPAPLDQPGTVIRDLALDLIRPNANQPRLSIDKNALEQLAESLRQAGVLQPVLVRPLNDSAYELVAGERRWRAARLAGLKTIPAIVRQLTDAESFELGLIENLQREDLDPLERATAYQQLIDKLGLTVDQIAQRLAQSRAGVVNYLRLLKLNEQIQAMIASGGLGMGQARAIAGITNPQRQLAVARLAARRNLSVRQVEALARRADDSAESGARPYRQTDPHLSDVAQSFSKALGLQVTLHAGKKKNAGRIVIRYDSLEEFDRIAEKLAGHSVME